MRSCYPIYDYPHETSVINTKRKGDQFVQHSPMYTHITAHTRYGPVALTVFTPVDATWICDQVERLPDNLHGVQSGVINVGAAFIVMERQPCISELRFECQSYRPVDDFDIDMDDPELTVFDYCPSV